jgi:anion-transporting  ArsA/GET3 family ATPase
LTAPLRSRLLNLATRPFTKLADRVLGTQFLTDTSRFFLLLQGMYDGFVERSNAVAALLRLPTTLFVVVTTPETIPVNEARRFVDALKARSLRLGVVIANKVLPSSLLDPATLEAADRMAADVSAMEADLAASGIEDAGGVARVLAAISENFENFAVLAGRQRALLDELRSRHDVVIELPHLLDEVVDVEALSRIGKLLLAEPTG